MWKREKEKCTKKARRRLSTVTTAKVAKMTKQHNTTVVHIYTFRVRICRNPTVFYKDPWLNEPLTPILVVPYHTLRYDTLTVTTPGVGAAGGTSNTNTSMDLRGHATKVLLVLPSQIY